MDKSAPAFVYANGLLLLTVAILPFPTALLGEYILTDHAAPAVVTYNAVLGLQAVAWILAAEVALSATLTKNEISTSSMRLGARHGYFAVVLYTGLAVAAVWFPRSTAAITTLTWVFWLIHSVRLKHEEP